MDAGEAVGPLVGLKGKRDGSGVEDKLIQQLTVLGNGEWSANPIRRLTATWGRETPAVVRLLIGAKFLYPEGRGGAVHVDEELAGADKGDGVVGQLLPSETLLD